MKLSDDYKSKYALWARAAQVYALPRFEGIPLFKAKKFSSYDEFNRWKRELLKEIARRGGVTWTK